MRTILDFCLVTLPWGIARYRVCWDEVLLEFCSSAGSSLSLEDEMTNRKTSRRGGHVHRRVLFSPAGLGIALAMVLLTPGFLGAQSSSEHRNADVKASKASSATAASTTASTMPRPPDGKPDLQGYWTSLSFTPLERPAIHCGIGVFLCIRLSCSY